MYLRLVDDEQPKYSNETKRGETETVSDREAAEVGVEWVEQLLVGHAEASARWARPLVALALRALASGVEPCGSREAAGQVGCSHLLPQAACRGARAGRVSAVPGAPLSAARPVGTEPLRSAVATQP